MVTPVIVTVAPGSMANTPLEPPPLMVTPAAGPVIEVVKRALLSSRHCRQG